MCRSSCVLLVGVEILLPVFKQLIFIIDTMTSLRSSSCVLHGDLQDAVCTLNTLQTNASALEQVKRERGHPQLQLQAMRGFLQRAGLKVYTTDTQLYTSIHH